MSRDLTPFELDQLDKQYDLRSNELYWVIDGKKQKWIHKDEAYREEFPNLTFLGEGIVSECLEMGYSHEFVRDIEDTLTYIMSGRKDDSALGEVVDKWYRGVSCGSIQYDHRYNNEAFMCQLNSVYALLGRHDIDFHNVQIDTSVSGDIRYITGLTFLQKQELFGRLNLPDVSTYGDFISEMEGTLELNIIFREGEIIPMIVLFTDGGEPYATKSIQLSPNELRTLQARINALDYTQDSIESMWGR